VSAPAADDVNGANEVPGLVRLARVLWRLGSFAVAWVLAQGLFESVAGFAFAALSRALGEPVPMYPYSMLVGVLGGCWAGIRFMDVAPWSMLGIGEGTWHPRLLATGAAIGAAAIALTMALLWGAQQVRFEAVPALGFVSDTWTGTSLRLLFVLGPAALWEELAFRGYLYGVAAEAGNRLLARSTTSVAFALVHLMNPGAGVRTTLIVMLAGWCLCVVRERLGLPGTWTAHLAWNWVMAAVLHVPVSGLPFATPGYRAVVDGPEWLGGGSWGPEGGLMAALVLMVTVGLAEWRERRPRPGQAATHVS
jgi:membrane protease YdiL (CAAX protease family)